jgi:hypothetical protein
MPPKPERRLRITSGPHQRWPDARPPLIAASPTTVSATTVSATTVSAVSVVTVMAVTSGITVVPTRGFVSVAPPAATGAEGDACDHQDNDHDHDPKKHSHPDPPFSGFPEFGPDFTFMRFALTNPTGGSRTVTTAFCGYALMRVRAGRIL